MRCDDRAYLENGSAIKASASPSKVAAQDQGPSLAGWSLQRIFLYNERIRQDRVDNLLTLVFPSMLMAESALLRLCMRALKARADD